MAATTNSQAYEIISSSNHEMKGEFIVCSVEKFIEHYMPFKRHDEFVDHFIAENLTLGGIDTTATSISDDHTASQTRGKTRSQTRRFKASDPPQTEDKHNVMSNDENGQLRFSAYPESPRSSTGSEDQSYRALADIAEAIGKFKMPGLQRNRFNYRHCPNKTIECDIQGSNNRIDACFSGDSVDDILRVSATGIAIPIEQKLKIADRYKERPCFTSHVAWPEYFLQNNIQLVSMNVQIMNDDVRRMFTFGITFESDEVTLWYHSRSHSAVSESFSFVKNPKLLVKVFMFFLFAPDQELGYNPRIIRHTDGSYTYQFEEPGHKARYFRTKKHLSAYRSSNITDRMSRVWLAAEVTSSTADVDPSQKEVALKDVWLDHNAMTERQLQKVIFEDVEAFWDSPQNIPAPLDRIYQDHADLVKSGDFKKYFLTILADFTGYTSVPTAEGARRKTSIFGSELLSPPINISSDPTRLSTGTNRPLPSHESQDIYRLFLQKKHYCVVFEEVCTTVGDLGTVGQVIDVLSSLLIPLQLMLCGEWVHRDISCRNVMAYKASDADAFHVKLADLEYAKKFPGPENAVAAVDPKTGTPFFMALEIMRQQHFFQPNQDNANDLPFDALMDKMENENETEYPKEQVVHNFQHDLESVWWILLWTILCRTQHEEEHSQKYASQIFRNTLSDMRERLSCFQDDIEDIDQNFEASVQHIARNMKGLSKALCYAYILRKRKEELRDVGSYTSIYSNFSSFFARLAKTRQYWNTTALVVKQAAYETVDTGPAVSNPRRVRPLSKRKQCDDIPSEASGSRKSKQGKRSKNS